MSQLVRPEAVRRLDRVLQPTRSEAVQGLLRVKTVVVQYGRLLLLLLLTV